MTVPFFAPVFRPCPVFRPLGKTHHGPAVATSTSAKTASAKASSTTAAASNTNRRARRRWTRPRYDRRARRPLLGRHGWIMLTKRTTTSPAPSLVPSELNYDSRLEIVGTHGKIRLSELQQNNS